MSEFLIQNHSMNFSLMMKDVNEELPQEVSQKIFILWQENYFLPFYQFFDNLKNNITEDINTDNVPLHFLRVLAAYTDNNKKKKNQLPIKEMIHIFFFGIMKNNQS